MAVAFAMELAEKGILSIQDMGGKAITFGDGPGMLTLLEKMARREGIGATLVESVKRAAEKIGRDSEEDAFQIKEQAFHDPRQDCKLSQPMTVGLLIGHLGIPEGQIMFAIVDGQMANLDTMMHENALVSFYPYI